jgi:uncharacterized protein YyaL (SSP411 family)
MAEHSTGVAWREWGEEAFAEAQAQDKPVLLDIGAVWCHWCHVMDTGIPGDPHHTGTYSDPDVQQRIAAHFIPIKVDNDRRPDINARYNMGGWPTTAFLTPSGDTLYGETYVPPGRMIALLDHISGLWQTQRDSLLEQTAQTRAHRAEAESPTPAEALDPNTAATVSLAILRNFDTTYGGFGNQPKFPHPDALLFALEQYSRTGDAQLREFAVKTLHGMASGGMYDQYAGGFFRYSTTRDWSVPHFEKMLEDNAKLTRVYAIASQILDDPSLMDVVRSAQGWLLSDMRDPETGAFAGSQDADKEEAYYGQPLAVRATMPKPYIDRTVYTGWNALMISSLVTRYKITGEIELLAVAQSTFSALYNETFHTHEISTSMYGLGVPHCYVDGQSQAVACLLDDQITMVNAVLDLSEATGENKYMKYALHLATSVLAVLEDVESGGFFDCIPDSSAIGELSRPKKDMTENAEAALALLRLSALTDDAKYRQAAERALRLFVGEYKQSSYFAASYARAVEATRQPPLHLVVVGDAADPRRWALQQAAWQLVAPGKAVETLSVGDAADKGYPAGDDGSPRAYVCIGQMCLAPVSTPDSMQERVREALAG